VWDYSTAGVGRGLTVGPVAAGLSTVVFSRLADQHGTRSFIRLGTALQLGSLLWAVLFLGPEPAYWTAFAPALMLFGLGWGMTTPLLNSLALSAVDERYWAETNAGFNTMRFVAAAIGTAGAIAIIGDPDRVDLSAAYDRTFLFFAVWIALAGVVVFLFLPSGAGRRRPAVTAPTASGPPARTSPPPTRPNR
jgi:MFS family permease